MLKTKKIKNGYYWSMDWRQFDSPNKSISDIKADFEQTNLNIKFFIFIILAKALIVFSMKLIP